MQALEIVLTSRAAFVTQKLITRKYVTQPDPLAIYYMCSTISYITCLPSFTCVSHVIRIPFCKSY